ADAIYNTDQVPTRRVRYARGLRMDALARQHVRQAHAGGQHLHANLARLRLRALFFDHLESLRSTVVGDDDPRVSHEMEPAIRMNTYTKVEFSGTTLLQSKTCTVT